MATVASDNGGSLDRRARLLRRQQALWTERASWDEHWREIAAYQMPRAGRFFWTDTNKGNKRHNSIYDNTAIFAHRTLAAGMMSGMTSPARPWFRLGIQDRDLMAYGPVKQWLYDVAEMMRAVFAAGNTYNALHQCYEELGAFGTWADFVRPDFENVIHHYPMTVGEYALATNDRGVVDTLIRRFQMSVGQMVRQFGKDRVSPMVMNLFDRGTLDSWVPVYHVIQPRDEDKIQLGKADNLNMPFESIYFEPSSDNWDRYLSESGFKRFPGLCPRWVVTGNDIYGRSPGMDVLGDVKQLQHEQLRKAQAIDYQVNPPLQVPVAYKDQANKRFPGGVMFVDATTQGGGVRPAYEVNLNLQYLLTDIQDTRERIKTGYFADLFLMMANDDRSGITATEVAERHEEKLLMLGPVLERLQNELLSPLVNMTFDRLVDAKLLVGRLAPPPELQGKDLEIEFVSTLAQAQRAVAAAGNDKLLMTAGQMAQIWPEVRHKIDPMAIIDDYADMFGVNPKVVVPSDKAQQEVQQEQQQMQQQQAAAQAPAMAQAAKNVAGIDPNNVKDLMNQFQGYGSPSPEFSQ